eukprot:Lankesteria_metandrocarpae@DN7565_c0_g1_i1.p1
MQVPFLQVFMRSMLSQTTNSESHSLDALPRDDMTAIVVDPTGQMPALLHRSVTNSVESQFLPRALRHATLVLKDAAVFRPEGGEPTLIITERSLVMCIP